MSIISFAAYIIQLIGQAKCPGIRPFLIQYTSMRRTVFKSRPARPPVTRVQVSQKTTKRGTEWLFTRQEPRSSTPPSADATNRSSPQKKGLRSDPGTSSFCARNDEDFGDAPPIFAKKPSGKVSIGISIQIGIADTGARRSLIL